jgi:hypothetical protein
VNTRKINKTIELIDSGEFFTDEDAEKELQEKGYPTEIISVDSGEHLLPRHIIGGVHFFAEYEESNPKDIDYLHMACDCALYGAITTRIELNCKKVKKLDSGDDENIAARNQLLEDCNRLGNLFWSAGYAFASRVMLDLGNHFSNLKNEESGALAQGFREEAVKYYCRAEHLMNDQPSQDIIKILYKGKGLEACGWSSLDAARADIFQYVSNPRIQALQKEVDAEMGKLEGIRKSF